MKRILAILCAVCMLLAMAACSVNVNVTDDALAGETAPAADASGEAASEEPAADASASGEASGETSGEQSASGEASGGMGMPGGSSGQPDSYDAVTDVTEDTEFTGETLSSENGSENVVHVYGGAVATIEDCVITNAGEGSGGDAASFYGVGATLLVSDGELFVSGADIQSSTAGGTGVFAYADGVAYVADTTIYNTGKGGCGGLHAAGGGTLYAWDCDVTTTGGSSAAIRSDRGGGLMVIDGGSYVSENGTGAVYCTADISVHNAYLYAGKSEAMAIEGKNTIRLFDCDLTGNMQPSAINDNRVWNCIVYQSMSGDSAVGTSEFDMIGGSLTCNAGPVNFTTNTRCYITFNGVDVSYGDETTYWLQCTGNSSSRTWGTAGKNGSQCIFSAYGQDMLHDVLYDTISTLDFYMLDGSAWEGAMLCDDSYNGGNSGDGVMNMYVDADSVWTVTGDSVVTGTLYLEGAIEGAKVVGTDGTVYVDGEGFTVTVGAFEESVDSSNAGAIPAWEDYAVEKPF